MWIETRDIEIKKVAYLGGRSEQRKHQMIIVISRKATTTPSPNAPSSASEFAHNRLEIPFPTIHRTSSCISSQAFLGVVFSSSVMRCTGGDKVVVTVVALASGVAPMRHRCQSRIVSRQVRNPWESCVDVHRLVQSSSHVREKQRLRR